MKLNKKLKWTLGLASMAALTTIPMSVALVGCSKGDSGNSNDQGNNNGVNLPYDSMIDLNKPVIVSNDKYQKIKTTYNKFLDGTLNEAPMFENSLEIATNFLANATKDEIEDIILISANSNANIRKYSYDDSRLYDKTFIDINLTKYDSLTKTISFEMNCYENYLWEYFYTSLNNEEKTFIQTRQTKLKYEINNMKIIPSVFNNYPILTFDVQNSDYEIKCVESHYLYDQNFDAFCLEELKKYKNQIIENNILTESEYDIEINLLDRRTKNENNFSEKFATIKNLDWSTIDFSSDYQSGPETFFWPSSSGWLSNGFGYVSVWENNHNTISKFMINISTCLPKLYVCQFSNNNNDIKVVN